MRKLFTALTLALCVSFAAPQAAAQFVLLPYLGYNTGTGFDTDSNDFNDTAGGFLIGVGSEFPLPLEAPVVLVIRPSVEVVLLPGEEEGGDEFKQTYFQINGDVVAKFAQPSGFTPYAGAGIAFGILTTSSDIGGSSNDESGSGFGFNVLGGVEFVDALPFGSPFVQVRYTFLEVEFETSGIEINKDSGGLAIVGGVAIPLGN
ncbi:MAG: outer membrane beta-barrel protein [Bacteroidota bacterium]